MVVVHTRSIHAHGGVNANLTRVDLPCMANRVSTSGFFIEIVHLDSPPRGRR